ncbi:MAG: hypothetical protein WCJ74_03190 [bacterium]
MKNILHKLHQKPEHHKKAVALGVSLIITLMIFGIWVSTLPSRLGVVGNVAKEAQQKLEEGITPLATVKASFDEAKQSLEDLKNAGFGQ